MTLGPCKGAGNKSAITEEIGREISSRCVANLNVYLEDRDYVKNQIPK